MIKVVVFDVGGVLVSGSMHEFYINSCKKLGIEPTLNFEKSPHIQEEYNCGKIGAREAFNRLFEKKLNEKEFNYVISKWKGTFTKNDSMYKLVNTIKEKGYRIAILSNSDQVVSDHLKSIGLYNPFEIVVLSHEEGFIKPAREIYESLINKLQVEPSEILFIDDNPKCIAVAVEIGINGIQYFNINRLINDLKCHGFDM